MQEYFRRWGTLLCALFFMGLGIAMVTNAHLGTTPISCLPLVLSSLCASTLGICTFGINALMFLAQIPLLGKTFTRRQFLQLPPLLFFSCFIDFGMWLTQSLMPELWAGRIAVCLLGCAVMAFGIMLEVLSGTTVLPGEGLVLALAWRLHRNFGNIKVLFDSSLVLCAALLSWLCLHSFEGIGEGTLLTALLAGFCVRLLSRWCGPAVKKWLSCGGCSNGRGELRG